MTSEAEARRAASMWALEEQFVEFIPRLRRLVGDTARQLQQGMSAGTYHVFSAVVRLAPVTPSVLADTLSSDTAHVGRERAAGP